MMSRRMRTGGMVIVAAAVPALLPAANAPQAPALPAPPRLEFVFEEVVTLAADITPGETALGRRNIVPITGGHFEGPGIRGTILPGGWDWQLWRADGCLHIKADYFLRTDDGVVINLLNQGVACPGPNGERPAVRTQPVFEAPRGKYQWLNQSAFIGTLEVDASSAAAPPAAVRIRIYRVL
ncbi:MAG: DUF3237 domain-containing protein [Gammaproteobacteria bacterium]|nr:DUF3237 domain-containing protein [Gammaproteobacteria bacterium]